MQRPSRLATPPTPTCWPEFATYVLIMQIRMSVESPNCVLQLQPHLHLPGHLSIALLRFPGQQKLSHHLSCHPQRHILRRHESQMRDCLPQQFLRCCQPLLRCLYIFQHSACPSGSWGDATAWLCVGSCPVGTYYANVTFPLCVTTCPANYYAYPPNRLCYAGGACPTSPVLYYSDDTTALCVTSCPANYFADTTTGRCLIYCSTNYFADQSSRTCVLNCPSGFFRSLVTRTCVRTCTTGYFADSATNNCTTQCTAGTFGDSLTGTCNAICTLPNYGDSTVKLCVPICSIGLYANNFTQSCVTASNCYSNTIGDPTTNKCISPQSTPPLTKVVQPALTCSQI